MKVNQKLRLIKQCYLSNKKAMSLSDQFCVERHKDNFLDLVKK